MFCFVVLVLLWSHFGGLSVATLGLAFIFAKLSQAPALASAGGLRYPYFHFLQPPGHPPARRLE
jgi:hypothetical protein